jgi:PAS domain S-box-containing protein
MKHLTSQALRVFVLGRFSGDIPPLAQRLAGLNVAPMRSPTLERLPPRLDDHDVLLAELEWLNTLTPEQREDLSRRAATAAGWIVVADGAARFKDQVDWQRLGVGHFFPKPLDPERLSGLIEDIHDRVAGPPVRAILLDDEESSLSYYSEVLTQGGIHVLATQDPLLVVEALDEHKPDVLVLDIEMPGCRGPELVTIVRQRLAYARLPVIFLTAMEGMQDKLLARAAAAEDFLVKPVAPELLLAAVESHALRYRAFLRGEQLSLRQQAQARLRLEQLRLAIDEHAIVSIADATGNIVHVNDKFCVASGYTRQELLGQNHRMIKSGHHDKAFYNTLWRTITRGRVWHGEICNRHKDGGLYWVEGTIFPIFNSNGVPAQFISIRTDITALKSTQEALRIGEERLRRGQTFANIGTWEWNIQTGELYWSERIAPLFGHAVGALTTSYDNFLAAIHSDDRQAVVDAVNACVAGVAPYEIEHRVVWPDGTVRWLLERGAVLPDAAGKPLKMLGVVQDIDDRKRFQLALTESEHRLREAQALTRMGNWEANFLTGELIWSDEIYEIFGRDAASFKPSVETFVAAVHPEDRARVAASERHSVATGTHDVIHRIVRPDGTVRHVHELARSMKDEHGKLLRLIGTVQDITERMEAEARLRESEERFSFAVEGAGDGIWDWNMLTGEMPLSGHYEAMLGFAQGDLEPTIDAWIGSVHPDDLPRVQQNLQTYLAGGLSVYEVELRLRCKDGGYKWILCRGTVVNRDKDGKPIRMIGIHSDISVRKQVEQSLIAAREEAERANRAKSEFLSSMSHELRTPMNAIIGFAQMLEYDSEITADQQDNVHEILKAGRHLLDLINEVLDLAKVESGRIELSMEGVDLPALGEDCRHLIQSIADQAGIRLSVELPTERAMVAVFADRVRLKQVLLNLLSNAIKYNRPGGSVRLTAAAGKPGHLRIAVTDTGPGIAPERIDDLFEPFNRLGAEAGEIEGTGIGLTITRRLVEMMGGEIGVESSVGVGSSFWLELALGQTTKVGADETAADSINATNSLQREANVLAIDDNPANLKLIAQVMGMREHVHLLTAHTPELGIELALAHRPDLILLDINMPGMDGYQVLKVLQASAELRHIPVVAITANAMPRDIERGKAAGFADYLTKPLDIGLFLQVADALLDAATTLPPTQPEQQP